MGWNHQLDNFSPPKHHWKRANISSWTFGLCFDLVPFFPGRKSWGMVAKIAWNAWLPLWTLHRRVDEERQPYGLVVGDFFSLRSTTSPQMVVQEGKSLVWGKSRLVAVSIFSTRSLGNGSNLTWEYFSDGLEPQSKKIWGEQRIQATKIFWKISASFFTKVVVPSCIGATRRKKTPSSATSLRFSFRLIWKSGTVLPSPHFNGGGNLNADVPAFLGGERKDGLCKMLLKLMNIILMMINDWGGSYHDLASSIATKKTPTSWREQICRKFSRWDSDETFLWGLGFEWLCVGWW